MNYYRGTGFGQMPPVIKNLLILNIIVFVATKIGEKTELFNLYAYLSLYYPKSIYFKPLQFITHIFMHGDIMHIVMNMFMLWMFGRILEQVWGGKRFFVYFFITGIGAAVIHTFVNYIEIQSVERAINEFANSPNAYSFYSLNAHKFSFILENPNIYSEDYTRLMQIYRGWHDNTGSQSYLYEASNFVQECYYKYYINVRTVGASGAVYGVLLAFGMTFPNVELFMIFLPFIPIKAKYMVIGMGLLELFYGVSQPGSNIAHFAHLGGMIFGFFLIRYWNKTTKIY